MVICGETVRSQGYVFLVFWGVFYDFSRVCMLFEGFLKVFCGLSMMVF